MIDKKTLLIIDSILLIFIFLILTFFLRNSFKEKEIRPGKTPIVFNNSEKTKVFAEIARSFQERQTGLMFRTSLVEDEGMIFVFDKEDRYTFWMKNTLIPLDMIFISKDKKVIECLEEVQPCKQDPCPSYGTNKELTMFILEVNSGFCRKHKINVGNSLIFDL